MPDAKKIIDVINPNSLTEWLVLENFFDWDKDAPVDEEKYEKPTQRLWYMLKSYIVRKKDADIFFEWAKCQDFMGRWMPETGDIIHVSLGEFFWSSAYKSNFNEDTGWTQDCRGTILPCEVLIPTINYLAEQHGYDCSIDDSIRITLPSEKVVNEMELQWNGCEYKFYNNTGEIVALGPSLFENAPSALLVRKQDLLNFLEKNDYDIIWTLLGEKGVLQSFGSSVPGRLDISGAYKIQNNEVVGKTTPTVERFHDS